MTNQYNKDGKSWGLRTAHFKEIEVEMKWWLFMKLQEIKTFWNITIPWAYSNQYKQTSIHLIHRESNRQVYCLAGPKPEIFTHDHKNSDVLIDIPIFILDPMIKQYYMYFCTFLCVLFSKCSDTRCICMSNSQIPSSVWAQAILHAALIWLHNKILSSKLAWVKLEMG